VDILTGSSIFIGHTSGVLETLMPN